MSNQVPEIEEIFAAAIELASEEERNSYLDRACAHDPQLRCRVEELLKAHFQAGSFLESPAPALDATIGPSFSEQPGTVIGPYKLLEQIGEGGMGVVYMADQQMPVRRRVALKIIKPGMDTHHVIARFDAERQALALMDHANIARVLDAGATDSRRPYFVMELVRGAPITEYCDKNNLPIQERLELFVQVCQAVQHAHQKGIIHRDLKPSNVLVTLIDSRPVPKVIDFGVAKAVNQQLTEKTLFTNFSQMIGTPLYMSPEQAEMSSQDVDTRSDIYSLGVLLYELLTGTTPVSAEQLKKVAFDELRRIIREEEPPPPSARISGSQMLPAIAAHRHIEAARLSRLVRGELDWIVMKSLERDRNRRYQTASAFAADVMHYVHDEPILACPSSVTYRVGKFLHRHRLAIATASLVCFALVAGTLASTWQAIRAMRAEQNADAARRAEGNLRQQAEIARSEAEQQRARAEANFRSALQSVQDYSSAVTDDVRLQSPAMQPLRLELLNSALNYYRRFIEQYRDDPAVNVEIADAYRRVGEISKATGADQAAEAALEQARDRYEKLVREQPDIEMHRAALARIYFYLGAVQKAISRLDAAEKSDTRAMHLYEQLALDFPGSAEHRLDAARTSIDLGVTQAALGKNDDAGKSLQSAIETLEVLAETRSEEIIQRCIRPELARAQFHLGVVRRATGRDNEAVEPLGRAHDLFAQLVEEEPFVFTYRTNLARAFSALASLNRAAGRPTDAEEYLWKSLDLYQQVAAENPTVAEYRMGLGWAHFQLGCHKLATSQDDAAGRSWSAASSAFNEALALGYRADQVYRGLGDAFAMLGNWQQAADAYRHVADASGRAPTELFQWATLRLAAGDDAGHRAACRELVARHAASASGMQACFIVMVCVAADGAVDDMSQLVSLAERLVASDPRNPVLQALLASAQFRAGDVNSAIAGLKQSLPMHATAEMKAPTKRDSIRASRVAGEIILTLAYLQQNDHPKVLADQLRQLHCVIDNAASSPPQFSEGTSEWTLPLAIHLARRELRRLETATDIP